MIRKITNYHPIHAFGEECGYLQTIQTEGFKAVEIEYSLDEDYRKQGIMTTYLPVYLTMLEDRGFTNITAHVQEDNIASKKLLKRNGFVKLNQTRNIETFIRVTGFKITQRDLETVRSNIVKKRILQDC